VSAVPITRGWKARLYPNAAQRRSLDLWGNHARGIWNRLLGAVVRQYEADGTFLWKTDLQKIVVAWKGEPDTAWMAELPAHAALDVCARLDKALKRMLSERKAGRQCGFPRFKKKRWGEGSVYFVNQATRLAPDGRTAKLPKLGTMRMRGGKVPIGRLLGSRAVRDGDKWMLAAQVECVRPASLPSTGARIGIDAGLRNLVTTFDGESFDQVVAPRPLRKALRRLRKAQRRLSRRQKTSARRRAQVKRVASLHRVVRCRRLDHLHKVSHRLTAKADAIVVETLDVRGITRTKRLGRLAADAAIGTLLQFVSYKADWRGRTLIEASATFPSTSMCCRCGTMNDMPLGKRLMSCGCGNRMDRDDNAAVNLYWYPEEPGNRTRKGATRGETGDQVAGFGLLPAPVVEPRMLNS
jgi:putative transposase